MILTAQGLGVALWLCPKKNSQVHEKLTTLSQSITTLFPGQPPKFEPHITITTNVMIDLENSEKTKDDVNRILSSCVAAISSLPKNHSNLVTLGRINSQRKYFKKLYFQVRRDPNLISFAQIIRELFVILPSELDRENRRVNPHLFVQSKSKSKNKDIPTKPLETGPIRRRATDEAAEWSISEFDPHLSIVYSDLYPIDNALWRTIKTRVQDYLSIENCEDEDLVDNGLTWDGGVLKLVLCEGDVADWITLGSVEV